MGSTIELAKELVKTEKQIAKVTAILEELHKRRAELLEKLTGR